MDELSHDDAAILRDYVRSIADDYGLRDWEFEVSLGFVAEPDTLAEIKCVYGRHSANLSISESFTKATPEMQREVIVHELTHIHFEWAWSVIRHDLADYLGQMNYDHTMASYRRQAEMGIDSVAHSIARFFPLIEWQTFGEETPVQLHREASA